MTNESGNYTQSHLIVGTYRVRVDATGFKISVHEKVQVSVDAAEPLPIELDGEQPGTTPARFEVVPQALRVRVPG